MKRAIRWATVVCAGLTGILLTAWGGSRAPIRLTADVYENPADGLATFQITGALPDSLTAKLRHPDMEFRIESGGESVRVLERSMRTPKYVLKLQTTTRPGPVTISASASGFDRTVITLQTMAAMEDRDEDGFPDVMRLTSLDDQERFRRWFLLVAESQYYRESPAWEDPQKDCSGLVRFAFREALRLHTAAWFQRVRTPIQASVPDIAKYNYPQTPLGDRLFRTRPGRFRPADLADETFSGFADARTLKSFNTVAIGKDRGRAKPGDLLFYYQSGAHSLPYHMMIYLGKALIDGGEYHDWVVYHTGPADGRPGVVKKVTLAMLDEHPSKRWRPVAENPSFLGFYRFMILD